MKQLLRPTVLFKNNYVDLSLLIENILFLLLLGILLWNVSFHSLMLILGTCAGLLIGTSVVLWELFRYRRKRVKDVFHLSYLPGTVNTVFIILIIMIRRMDWNVSIFFAFFGYHFSRLVCLFIIERRIKKRFRWIEFYPK